MDLTQSLGDYRENLGLTQDELVILVGRAGFQNLAGDPAISRLTISRAETGRTISRRMARAISLGLSLGYEMRGKQERFTADDILELVEREAQKRARNNRDRPDRPNEEDKEEDGLAVAV